MKFLLISNDQSLTTALQEGLESQGHAVAIKRTRSLGSRQLLSDSPDVVVVDWAGMSASSLRAYRRLRRHRSRVPVVMLLDGRSADEGGDADAYLVKPVEVEKLLGRAEVALETEGLDHLRCEDLILDIANSRVVRGGNDHHLTPKQLWLLKVLMQNAGDVLSRKVLMTKVWDTDYLGDTRTMDVHICWLREKIERDPGAPELIRTVRGVGYRFTGELI
jgi:DNA-binding response OmpR family regulator